MSEITGKTIAQIAAEVGVSKTAVRKKLTDEIRNQFSETIGNTVYINKQGESLIKSTFSQSNGNQVSENQTETVSVLVSILQKELDIKNDQIRELNARLAESNAALVAAQQTAQAAQALHAGTIQQQLVSGGSEPSETTATPVIEPEQTIKKKKSFFSFRR